jgi:hypothetical protein
VGRGRHDPEAFNDSYLECENNLTASKDRPGKEDGQDGDRKQNFSPWEETRRAINYDAVT